MITDVQKKFVEAVASSDRNTSLAHAYTSAGLRARDPEQAAQQLMQRPEIMSEIVMLRREHKQAQETAHWQARKSLEAILKQPVVNPNVPREDTDPNAVSAADHIRAAGMLGKLLGPAPRYLDIPLPANASAADRADMVLTCVREGILDMDTANQYLDVELKAQQIRKLDYVSSKVEALETEIVAIKRVQALAKL